MFVEVSSSFCSLRVEFTFTLQEEISSLRSNNCNIDQGGVICYNPNIVQKLEIREVT